MSPLADVRTRWRALRVFVIQAQLDAEIAATDPSISERKLDSLVRAQRRTLRGLYETARVLPRDSPLRKAAERAFDTGSSCLVSDPDSEAFAVAAHEYELALAELRARLRPRLFS